MKNISLKNKIMPLYDSINSLYNSKAIIKSSALDLSYEDLMNFRESKLDLLVKLNGLKVALIASSNFDLAKWILILDGIVSDLLIIPFCLDKSVKDDFLVEAEIDAVIENSQGFLLSSELAELDAVEAVKVDLKNISLKVYETKWILTTSGTTGTPKLVAHSISSLSSTVKKKTSNNQFVWGLVYGLTRFAGVQVFLQAILNGNTLVIGSSDESNIEFFVKAGVNCISATPTQWRKYLMSKSLSLLKLTTITLGGEIADQATLNALSKLFPDSNIRHIYASTEAGVGFSISDRMAGFPASFIDSKQANVYLRVSVDNTLMIKSRALSLGYIGKKSLPIDDVGYIDTGDKVELKKGRYIFLGRANGSINIGGNKVQPEFIENVLLEFPLVKVARVRGKSSPIMGSLVVAEIEIVDIEMPHKELVKKIKEFCRVELESFMVPAIIKIVDEIPLNQSGKVLRV